MAKGSVEDFLQRDLREFLDRGIRSNLQVIRKALKAAEDVGHVLFDFE